MAIVGGGPLGMALALALAQRGIASCIHDARPRRAALQDQRVLALSHGARQILERLGVWPDIDATPITRIHISQQGGLGRAQLSAAEQGVAALGQVCAAASISRALDRQLDQFIANGLIEFHEQDRVEAIDAHPDQVTLHTAHGTHKARLVVYAEGGIGAHSDPAATVSHDYHQQAVICSVTPRKPHDHLAFERFTPHGPLALLPFGANYALVYTCPSAQAADLAALPDAEFIARLEAEFAQRLAFTAIGARHVFPLALRYRKSPVDTRAVWLGNAAQTLHPVAGQGFNLALRDAWELARTLGNARDAEHDADPGAPRLLQQYAAARRLDRRSMIGFTDGLIQLFGSDNPVLQHGRGLGLLALDLVPPLRSFITRRMMFGARAWP